MNAAALILAAALQRDPVPAGFRDQVQVREFLGNAPSEVRRAPVAGGSVAQLFGAPAAGGGSRPVLTAVLSPDGAFDPVRTAALLGAFAASDCHEPQLASLEEPVFRCAAQDTAAWCVWRTGAAMSCAKEPPEGLPPFGFTRTRARAPVPAVPTSFLESAQARAFLGSDANPLEAARLPGSPFVLVHATNRSRSPFAGGEIVFVADAVTGAVDDARTRELNGECPWSQSVPASAAGMGRGVYVAEFGRGGERVHVETLEVEREPRHDRRSAFDIRWTDGRFRLDR